MAGKTRDSEVNKNSKAKSGPSSAPGKAIKKGDQYLCEICALSLHVDECAEFLESKGPVCCGQPMKAKATTGKPAKK